MANPSGVPPGLSAVDEFVAATLVIPLSVTSREDVFRRARDGSTRDLSQSPTVTIGHSDASPGGPESDPSG
jgi:hypothetical protein